MLDIKVVEELVKPYLEQHELKLYEVKWVKEFGFQILRVLVDKKGGIDVDSLALVNDYLSEKLDAYEADLPDYMLEVSSPGAEKELRTKDEIKDAIDEYINVKTSDMTYEGYLISYEDDKLVLEINIKGRMKKVTILDSDIKKIRLAVKI